VNRFLRKSSPRRRSSRKNSIKRRSRKALSTTAFFEESFSEEKIGNGLLDEEALEVMTGLDVGGWMKMTFLDVFG
jgi:hypothetical protein